MLLAPVSRSYLDGGGEPSVSKGNLLILVGRVLELFLYSKTTLSSFHSFCISIFFQKRKRSLELSVIVSGSWWEKGGKSAIELWPSLHLVYLT